MAIEITMEWHESCHYTSHVTIQDTEVAEIRQWLKDGGDEEWETREIDAPTMKDWLTSGEEEDWFGKCDVTMDLSSVEERYLDRVSID